MIAEYLITLAVFLGIDAVWLTIIAKNLYKKSIGHLMAKNPRLFPALAFYLLFAFGLLFFVITPAANWQNAMLNGALFGLIAYATYDLTNQATLKKWPEKITIIDLIWGSFLSAAVSTVSFLIISLI